MPRKTDRPGKRLVYVELPEELVNRVDALRKRNRHTLTAAVELALDMYLRADWPVLPDPPSVAPAPKRPRGRPRKQS